jgi:hypothetical protein
MSYTERPTSELGSDIGQTIRMPSNSIMTIDSRDRYQSTAQKLSNPTSPYNFTVTKSESLFNGFFTRIGLTEVNFPWNVPNINYYSESIQITTYTNAGGPGTAVSTIINIPIGFLTENNVASELSTAIEAYLATQYPGANYEVQIVYAEAGKFTQIDVYGTTVSVNPQSFAVDLSGAFTLSFSPDPSPDKATYNNLFAMMGLRSDPIVGGVPTGYLVGSPTNVTFTSYVDIVSRRLVAYQNLYDTTSAPVNRNILCRLYLNTDNNQLPTQYFDTVTESVGFAPPLSVGSSPVTIYRQFRNPKMLKYLSDVPVGQLDFVVYDDRGNELTQIVAKTFGAASALNMPDYQMSFLASEN